MDVGTRDQEAAPGLLAITPERAARELNAGRAWFDGLLAGLRGTGLPDQRVFIQIRDKRASPEQIRRLSGQLRERSSSKRFVWLLSGDPELAAELEFGGVHLPSSMVVQGRPTFNCPSMVIGTSTHSARELAELDYPFDYAVLGPVFDTPSKRKYGRPLGLEEFQRGCLEGRKLGIPTIGIGGIDRANINQVLQQGATGVAGIRAFGNAEQVATIAALLARAATSNRCISSSSSSGF